MTDTTQTTDLQAFTTEIVSSYLTNNELAANDVPALITSIYQTLQGLATGETTLPATSKEPAVAVKKSITPDYIICLEDGKKLKMLKRHLKTAYNLTPEEYRAKWNLPSDYPMVAPNYAKKRSALAKDIGLGKKTTATRGRKKAA
ncbi:MAG: MucR family transcriptional regulator [Pseudobdellovibrionaceae bacterium]